MMNLKECKVLLADDIKANINILKMVLKNNYDVAYVQDGKSVLKYVESNPTDLILLDILMPGMNGYEVCRRLKADECTKDIPIIFITSMSNEENEAQGFELGAVDYIIKPFSKSVVKARVKTHLSLKLAREELEMQNAELREAARLREDVERISRHDLKTPLNGIIALPQILMKGKNLTDKQIQYLNKIKESGYNMLNMINSSLDLFNMERGVYKFHPMRVNILEIIDKIIFELKSLAEQKDLSVKIVVHDNTLKKTNTLMICGEELLSYSMFANLIKNAMEASPEGDQITIKIYENSYLLIYIHNKGSVPEKIRDSFFEKYTTYGKHGGTGIGTYSAKLIAETQKGKISMTTSEKSGTTINVKLIKATEK
ncbi:hypothetical protein GMMP1_260015 [Candidatus Magnetomoraceae bacterium gMMP-1]